MERAHISGFRHRAADAAVRPLAREVVAFPGCRDLPFIPFALAAASFPARRGSSAEGPRFRGLQPTWLVCWGGEPEPPQALLIELGERGEVSGKCGTAALRFPTNFLKTSNFCANSVLDVSIWKAHKGGKSGNISQMDM